MIRCQLLELLHDMQKHTADVAFQQATDDVSKDAILVAAIRAQGLILASLVETEAVSAAALPRDSLFLHDRAVGGGTLGCYS